MYLRLVFFLALQVILGPFFLLFWEVSLSLRLDPTRAKGVEDFLAALFSLRADFSIERLFTNYGCFFSA